MSANRVYVRVHVHSSREYDVLSIFSFTRTLVANKFFFIYSSGISHAMAYNVMFHYCTNVYEQKFTSICHLMYMKKLIKRHIPVNNRHALVHTVYTICAQFKRSIIHNFYSSCSVILLFVRVLCFIA